MSKQYTRPISIKSLVRVSQVILVYVDKHGNCTASNETLARDAGVGLATARGAITWLIGAEAVYAAYEWLPEVKTLRTLTLPPRDNKWRGAKIDGRWVRDPFD